jgi:hypothetical protein
VQVARQHIRFLVLVVNSHDYLLLFAVPVEVPDRPIVSDLHRPFQVVHGIVSLVWFHVILAEIGGVDVDIVWVGLVVCTNRLFLGLILLISGLRDQGEVPLFDENELFIVVGARVLQFINFADTREHEETQVITDIFHLKLRARLDLAVFDLYLLDDLSVWLENEKFALDTNQDPLFSWNISLKERSIGAVDIGQEVELSILALLKDSLSRV